MNYTKLISGILTVTILSLSAFPALAINNSSLQTTGITEKANSTEQTNLSSSQEFKPSFSSFTGTVKKISDSESVKGLKYVSLEDAEGQAANLVISDSTFIVNDAKIDIGSVITGFYDANAPMILIYPPQYSTDVVYVADSQDKNIIKVDKFDSDLVSSDNFLKLNVSKDTQIVSQDGKVYEGKLANKKLVVFYTVSTKSIPSQTNPSKVVVLFEKETVPAKDLVDGNESVPTTDATSMNIVVNNKVIEAPALYTNNQGVIMVPLRAVAEALKFDVIWDAKSKKAMVGKVATATIGQDYYTYVKTAPIQLGTAPEIVKGRTFVPLSFFNEVMRLNAEVDGSRIVINE